MNLPLRAQNLQRRSFRGQDLRQANFSQANLCGADFTDAVLDGADFSHADLRGTIFRRSSLVGANLSYSRSGVPIDRSIILQAILLLLALLLGLLAGFVGSSVTGLLTDESQVFQPYHDIKFPISWHTVSGVLAVSYGIIFGSLLFVKNPATAIMLGVGSIIIIDTIVVGSIVQACQAVGQSWDVVGYMAIAIGGSAMLIIFQGVFTTICLAIVVSILNANYRLLLATIIGVLTALSSVINVKSSGYIQVGTVVGASAIIYTSFQIGSHQRSSQQKHDAIRTISTYFSTYYGTCCDRANLTSASLEYALLSQTNLSRANLTHTNFYGARQLDLARLDRTLLIDSLVRDLVVTHQGAGGNYQNCDLHGAYLVGADLDRADFTGADLQNVNLHNARLEDADLTRVLAAAANFQGANLTGACIADWSIDRTTNLTDINCDYIYLKSLRRERSPVSGNFQAGDFARIFQEIWNTVELIFQHGVDWTSFNIAWQQIQVEHSGLPLVIHSIERKGEGTIVIKVEVPVELDKTRLHQDFKAAYDLRLQSIEACHQVELAGRDRELAIYQSQQAQLNQILHSLITPTIIKPNLEQLVTIKLGSRDLDGNLAVTVEIGDRGLSPRAAAIGSLSNETEALAAYADWQSAYRSYLGGACRIDIPDRQITNLGNLNLSSECQRKAESLRQQINKWLDSANFRSIKDLMLQELQPEQSIQIVLQTDCLQIRQLPFQLWSFFERFPHAELAIANNVYRSSQQAKSITLQPDLAKNLQVLAIFGDRQGIDLDLDRQLLTNLANATIEFLTEPTRQLLNDKLWEKPWDIIFFAGHSNSDDNLSTGYLKINPTERLTIAELKYALQQTIASGLQLLIINACNGLGLAAESIALQIPQTIVMREPIPDVVAQQFLKVFLTAFTSGKSLYSSVRLAREQLQGLEDKYPCASWLPVIFQNPADIFR
jgi:uncharacterized protein YjbI with pentapeptide repeats